VVLSLLPAALGVGVTLALAAAAIASRALTPSAGLAAAAFGIVVVAVAGFAFLGVLVLFVVAGVLATRYGFEDKRRAEVQEGRGGERGVSNVLAHVIAPTALVLVNAISPQWLPSAPLAVLYTAALAFGASDTFASEFGVLAGRARSILTLRPVPPGTNGGVSDIGQAWAVIGALALSVVAWALFLIFHVPAPMTLLVVGVPSLAGFLGCQVDSVLGATLENRGYLTKGSTNFLGMVASIAIATVVLVAAGGWR
jgi:uncharacterized protein (TIGR00297 family)